MTYTQLRSNIILWIAEAVGVTVIRANQSAPRPDPPYISVNITSMDSIGMGDYSLADTNGDQTITQDITLSISVQGYGPTVIDELQKIRAYTLSQAGEESLNTKGMVFMSDNGIRENTVTIDITTEERFLYELFINTAIQDIENTSYIETVDITDNIIN
jgi:hypothetical protein